jgi:predicted DNA binding protein
MRELRIVRPLDPANELEALILKNPGLHWRALKMNVSEGKQTILMHFRGSKQELENLKREYIQHPPRQLEGIEILREMRNDLFVYEVEKSGVSPTDTSGLIYNHLGPETLVEVEKGIDGVRWKIFTFRDERVPMFLRKVEEHGRQLEQTYNRKVTWYRLTAQSRRSSLVSPDLLDADDQKIVRTAIEMGYYDQPKRAGLLAVAKKLGMPRSTVHYHLSRAEKKLLRRGLETLD